MIKCEKIGQGLDITKAIISPPFGNYIHFKGATNVYGSYTLHRRIGAFYKFIKTFRAYRDDKGNKIGYVNSIGLKNKGIKNLSLNNRTQKGIISLAVLEQSQWRDLADVMLFYLNEYDFMPRAIEINLSCPNVKLLDMDASILKFFDKFNVIVKLPPKDKALYYIEKALDYNVVHFHLCNTLPSKFGGISGEPLKKQSLAYIAEANNKWGDKINIIGGGGIYNKCDVDLYQNAGAKYYSLSTIIWKNPFEVQKLIDYINTK